MLGFLSFVLIVLSVLFFLMGYAYLTDKAERLMMWSFTGKVDKVTDKEGYKKQQGKNSILMGIIFFLVPVSLLLVNNFETNPKLLYLWLFVLAGVTITNAVQIRKYF
ncbi:DUF3784 domain-containing protein [Planococcus salinus]|uniref:DUF3784 domain-containing protein n=1 Tax=Planococcus salinus TaxID=1848460 RepID=A0A3M8PC87_9BACL|nr:DUF3784 domain-containing protein [Planococcus salinus]RNF41222.1 DUF3784 domain-containing protein [Planococcus salinus]